MFNSLITIPHKQKEKKRKSYKLPFNYKRLQQFAAIFGYKSIIEIRYGSFMEVEDVVKIVFRFGNGKICSQLFSLGDFIEIVDRDHQTSIDNFKHYIAEIKEIREETNEVPEVISPEIKVNKDTNTVKLEELLWM